MPRRLQDRAGRGSIGERAGGGGRRIKLRRAERCAVDNVRRRRPGDRRRKRDRRRSNRGCRIDDPTEDGRPRQGRVGRDGVFNLLDELRRRPGRVQAGDQRHRAGHERRGDRRPLDRAVPTPDQRRLDANPRRGEVDRLRPEVRERRELAILIGRGHRDLVRQVKRRREKRRGIVVRSVVARRGHQHHSLVAGGDDRVVKHLAGAIGAPARVGDPGAVRRGVENRSGRLGIGAVAVRIDELEHHHLR